MSHPLDHDDDDLDLPTLRPGQMSMSELANALDALAADHDPAERDLLEEAAGRLKLHAMMRDALADRVAEVERLKKVLEERRKELRQVRAASQWMQRELDRLRGGAS